MASASWQIGSATMEADEMEKLCRYLNEFSLPRAVVDFAEENFVAWNRTFLARTGYSEERNSSSETSGHHH